MCARQRQSDYPRFINWIFVVSYLDDTFDLDFFHWISVCVSFVFFRLCSVCMCVRCCCCHRLLLFCWRALFRSVAHYWSTSMSRWSHLEIGVAMISNRLPISHLWFWMAPENDSIICMCTCVLVFAHAARFLTQPISANVDVYSNSCEQKQRRKEQNRWQFYSHRNAWTCECKSKTKTFRRYQRNLRSLLFFCLIISFFISVYTHV